MAESNRRSRSISEWSSKKYKLNEFLDRFTLPQTIKVHESYLDENDEITLSVDDVLTLHRYDEIPKVLAISPLGEEESVPLTCAVKVDRVSEEFAKTRLSSWDVLRQLSKVRFVRVVENDTEAGLTKNNKFKVKYKTVENHGNSFSFLLSTLTKPKKVFKINQDCKATFQVVLDANEYLIAQIVKKFGLPNYVWFVDNTAQENPKQRVLKLQSTFTETFVIASTLVDSNSEIKLPKDLEVTVFPSLEAEKCKSNSSKVCWSSNEKTSIETDVITNTMSERADSVYEDMRACHTRETEIASLKKDQIKREISKDATGNIRIVIPNTYTETPLVSAISNRNGIYDTPKKATAQPTSCLGTRNSQELFYETPRTRTQSQVERDSCGSLSQRCFSEYACMDSFSCSSGSSFSSALGDESEDHIYQEIAVFRELPEEMKDRSSGNQTLKLNESITTIGKFELSSSNEKDYKFKTELTQNSNTYQLDPKMTDKSKPTRKLKARDIPTNSSQALYENYNLQEGSLSDCHFASNYAESRKQDEKTISPQPRRASSGGFEGSRLGNAISDALLKNKLFASKADNTGAKLPPEPPPRTSSKKSEDLQTQGSKNESTGTSGMKKTSEPSLPESITNVRRSASTAGNISCAKEKNKFESRPLPVPKARSPSIKIKDSVSEAFDVKGPTTSAPGPSLKTGTVEKITRPKPLVPPKTPSPLLAPIRTKCDGSEGYGSLPRDPRRKEATSIDSKKQANLSTKKGHSEVTRTKSGNELIESLNKQTDSTVKKNRSQSLNEIKGLNTNFVIPDNLRGLGVTGVAECLKKLKMEHLVEFFESNQIDGEMLLSLDDDVMSEMGIEKFHRLKLVKFIGGWRPLME